jgi:hypothetical protein
MTSAPAASRSTVPRIVSGYPKSLAEPGHVEAAPRRVRGFWGGRVAFDTVDALYVWEWPNYPRYHVPLADRDASLLGELRHRVHHDGALAGTVRYSWDALDAWFEEDEEVFVHPRNPYARVDAPRSTRAVRDGVPVQGADVGLLVGRRRRQPSTPTSRGRLGQAPVIEMTTNTTTPSATR